MKRFLHRAGLASCFCQFVLFSFKVWLILLFVGCVAGGSWCFFFSFVVRKVTVTAAGKLNRSRNRKRGRREERAMGEGSGQKRLQSCRSLRFLKLRPKSGCRKRHSRLAKRMSNCQRMSDFYGKQTLKGCCRLWFGLPDLCSLNKRIFLLSISHVKKKLCSSKPPQNNS